MFIDDEDFLYNYAENYGHKIKQLEKLSNICPGLTEDMDEITNDLDMWLDSFVYKILRNDEAAIEYFYSNLTEMDSVELVDKVLHMLQPKCNA